MLRIFRLLVASQTAMTWKCKTNLWLDESKLLLENMDSTSFRLKWSTAMWLIRLVIYMFAWEETQIAVGLHHKEHLLEKLCKHMEPHFEIKRQQDVAYFSETM